MKKKVIVAFSGGIDSTYAVFKLLNDGYDVETLTMCILDKEDYAYKTEKDVIEKAKKMSIKLGVKHNIVNLKNEFEKYVHKPLIDGYLKGETPNPCVLCNRYIKFSALYNSAMKLGADYFATGHYCNIINENGSYKLLMACNKDKDQSYFLHGISKEKLDKILFPLASIEKKQIIREELINKKLITNKNRESMGICFVKDLKIGIYIRKFIDNLEKGYFRDENGKIIGVHKGIIHYTIGQKVILNRYGKLYVKKIDCKENSIYLGLEESIFKNEVIIKDVIYTSQDEKIHYSGMKGKIGQWAELTEIESIKPIDNDRFKVLFKRKVRGPQRGQALVWYFKNKVIAGGIIE